MILLLIISVIVFAYLFYALIKHEKFYGGIMNMEINGVAMNSGTQAAKEASNMVDLDSDPNKLLEVIEIGKHMLITRGNVTTFSIVNDVAKYFAIVPAIFAAAIPGLNALNIMKLESPQTAVMSAVIFNAFIIPTLVALALRESTQQVERKITKEIPVNSRPGLNAIMACINTNSNNAVNIIRRASRIASLYKSSWYVVYVQTPMNSVTKINSKYQRKLINNFKLAVELGADVVKLTSNNVAEALVNFAQEKEIGLILVGKPHVKFLSRFFRRNLFKEILKETEFLNIDIIIMVSTDEET